MTDLAKGQLVLHGFHRRQINGQAYDEPTAYPVDWPATLAGKTFPGSFVVDAEADFVLTSISHAQADTATFLPVKINIQDDSGRSVFKDAAYLNTISSQNAGQPYILPKARVFNRTSAVRVNLTVDA